jgi:streptomycin 6-kinase
MTNSVLPKDLRDRMHQHAQEWRLEIEVSFETESSIISVVSRAGESLVLKLIKQPGDEWNAGEVLSGFDGRGVVRVYEHRGGAMLLECLRPGSSLSQMNDDEEATETIAHVIKQMSPREAPADCSTVADWGKGFARYLASGDKQIPGDLVESAKEVFADLCASQTKVRLLHGDLHHYNILADANRGWIAIDPKGVIGEIEYEIGAVLRNPFERPELFLSRRVIERRLKQFVTILNIDYERTLAWAFAQAVLSAIWQVEDGRETSHHIQLAETLQPLVKV